MTAHQLLGKALRRAARRLDAAQARLLREPPGAVQGARTASSRRRSQRGGYGITRARESFFQVIEDDGDVAMACVATVRDHLDAGRQRPARTFAQVLQHHIGLADVGDICMGMVAAHSRMVETAWQLLSRPDLAAVLRLAPAEYFRVGFEVEPDTARKALEAVVRQELALTTDAFGWLDVASTSFAAGAEDLSRFALDRAQDQLSGRKGGAAARARTSASWLAEWYGRRSAAPDDVPADEVPIAVVGYRQPDRTATSSDLGEYLESLAILAHVARRSGLRVTGEADLAAFANELVARVPQERAVTGDTPSAIRLYPVDRDATSYAPVPDGTWLLVVGRLPRRMFRLGADLPFDPRLRPIFLSLHIDSAELLTPDVLSYLRRFAPIGCRDWATVFLLQAADIPAFFLGGLVSTVDLVARPRQDASGGRLFVDVPATAVGETATQDFAAVRDRDLVLNLRDALARVDDYRGRSQVVTSRLESYLAARSLGTPADLRPENPADRRFDGLLELDDAAFARMQETISDRIAALLGAITSAAESDDVYALWRELCAADVRAAEAERSKLPDMPPPRFDVAGACAAIRTASTTIERREPGPAGAEINVELSLDANYKHQLEVVLDSIITHASRPVRAFVLCREHTPADYDRLAALFPTVSFVWLPTDGVDYGPISGLLGYTTVATMDRLLLPDLLPEIDRIVHHDLDALCLADLAELYDVDVTGVPIAGRGSPLPSLDGGFASLMRQSQRFRRNPALGRELLRRTHTRHGFDFRILNAGIMLMNLEVMRADQFCRNFVPYVERFGMNDQAVLNVYAGGNRVEVAAGWNWRPWLEVVDEPKIAHWAGKYKPWSRPWVYGKELWQDAEARLARRYEQAGLR